MKILKHGTVPDEWELDGKCAYCGCEFKFLRIESTAVTSPWGEKFWSVKCPEPECWYTCTVKVQS
jgi:hypothetical protein